MASRMAGITVGIGGIHLTVNGYNVQDGDALASMAANKINEMLDEDGTVFKQCRFGQL